MAAQTNIFTTPVNTITRENLTVLITNNMLNNSLEFASDCEMMETDSPIRNPCQQPISKKLFHSPDCSPTEPILSNRTFRIRKAKKRKQVLIPDAEEHIKKAYVKECDRDAYSPDVYGGMRKRVLTHSLLKFRLLRKFSNSWTRRCVVSSERVN